MNEFEKLCGLGSEGGGMRSASVFADDAWFTLGQFISRGKFYTLDGVDKVASGSFPDVTHAVMLVMKAGHPRANFSPPAPAPANTHTRIYGCGIPVNTGVGSRHSHGFAN